MSKLVVRFKRPLAFVLTLLLTVMLFPLAGDTGSVSACHLERIEIYPETATITMGESITYTAEAFDNNGQSMGDITWYTNFFIEYGAGGYWSSDNIYRSENPGTWVVAGEFYGKTDTATLTVRPHTGTIVGTVFDDKDGDGVQEDGEGGFVKLYVCQNRKCDTSTTGRSIVAATTGQGLKRAA